MIAFEIRFLKISFKDYFPWRKIFLIIMISFFSLIPFILIEVFFKYGVILTMLYGILYLIMVAILELRYNLFVLPKDYIVSKTDSIGLKNRFF
jgi:uncharacterized membrane protein